MSQGIKCSCGCASVSYDTVWFEALSAWRIPDHLNDSERTQIFESERSEITFVSAPSDEVFEKPHFNAPAQLISPKTRHCWTIPCASCGRTCRVWATAETLVAPQSCELCCKHYVLEEGRCLDCAADFIEKLSAEAYDRAKAARQDGDI